MTNAHSVEHAALVQAVDTVDTDYADSLWQIAVNTCEHGATVHLSNAKHIITYIITYIITHIITHIIYLNNSKYSKYNFGEFLGQFSSPAWQSTAKLPDRAASGQEAPPRTKVCGKGLALAVTKIRRSSAICLQMNVNTCQISSTVYEIRQLKNC